MASLFLSENRRTDFQAVMSSLSFSSLQLYFCKWCKQCIKRSCVKCFLFHWPNYLPSDIITSFSIFECSTFSGRSQQMYMYFPPSFIIFPDKPSVSIKKIHKLYLWIIIFAYLLALLFTILFFQNCKLGKTQEEWEPLEHSKRCYQNVTKKLRMCQSGFCTTIFLKGECLLRWNCVAALV